MTKRDESWCWRDGKFDQRAQQESTGRGGERVEEIKGLSFGEQRRETAQKRRDKELNGSCWMSM